VRAAEKAAKVVELQRREVISGIMSVGPGRKWMCELLESCHCFATSFSDIGLRMAFCEGQREVGIRLLSDIMSACPDQYITMMRERNERQSAIDARSERRDQDADGRYSDAVPDDESGDDAADFYDVRGEDQPRQ